MLRLSAVLVALSSVPVGLGDCGRSNPPAPVPAVTVPVRCDVGGRPGYFVPSSGAPPELLGCARLGVGGRRVEFSRDRTRIDGEPHLCINPAYSRGRFIPAICTLHPRPGAFRVHDASQPRQAVRGHRYVVWGTAPAGTAAVTARARPAVARARAGRATPSPRAATS